MTTFPIPIPPGGLLPLPTVFGPTGLQQTPPAVFRANLLQLISSVVPGYTADLPGVLIEDILSTDIGALSVVDSARIELLNSLTPYGCNAFILNQLGRVYGVPLGVGSNTSVFVQFEASQTLPSGAVVPVPGYIIPKGFTISDGQFQYQIVDGGTIGSDGTSPLLYALATISGSWPVPAGTVTEISSSVPSGFTLTILNPEPGIPGPSDETETSYRSRVLTAGLAATQGMARYLKTLLANVLGVQQRLVGIQQDLSQTKYIIIVGGGDPYQVAYAIYTALFDINHIIGSTYHIVGISVGTNGASTITVDLNTAYVPNQPVEIQSSVPPDWNGNYVVYSVPSPTTFVLGKAFAANQISSLAWVAGVATAITLTNHGVTPGSLFTLIDNSPSGWNGTFTAIAGTTATTLKWNLAVNPGAETALGQLSPGTAIFDGSVLPAYVGSGTVLPNPRNQSVNLVDYPDTYTIPFVVPPQQRVVITATWNTSLPNFINQAAISQAAVPAIVEYINSIFVGQPINIYQLQTAFEAAVANILPAYLITRLVFSVSIDGVGTLPDAGTGIIVGDPQSFFFAQAPDINVVQG